MTGFGYAGEILGVNLSDGSISKIFSGDYTDMFLGGRGIASRLYWEKVPSHVKVYDPHSRPNISSITRLMLGATIRSANIDLFAELKMVVKVLSFSIRSGQWRVSFHISKREPLCPLS